MVFDVLMSLEFKNVMTMFTVALISIQQNCCELSRISKWAPHNTYIFGEVTLEIKFKLGEGHEGMGFNGCV